MRSIVSKTVSLLSFVASPAVGQSVAPSAGLDVTLSRADATLSGEMRYENLPEGWESHLTLHVPTWDDVHATESARLAAFSRFITQPEDTERLFRSSTPRIHILSTEKSPRALRIRFTTHLEASHAATTGQWILTSWYPELRTRSTGAVTPGAFSLRWHAPETTKPVFTLSPRSCPGENTSCFQSDRALRVTGVIDERASVVETTTRQGKRLVGVYRHGEFKEIFWSLAKSAEWLEENLGSLPNDTLIAVENVKPLEPTHPGLVPVQIPAQAGVRWAFTQESEWTRWRTLEALVAQWWGAAVPMPGHQGILLREGLASYYALRLMDGPAMNHRRFLNGSIGGATGITWNFLEHTLAFLAILHRNQSAWLSDEAASVGFARIGLALRHAAKTYGEAAFETALARTWRSQAGAPLRTVESFLEGLVREMGESLPPVAGTSAETLLREWLQTDEWWDPSIDAIEHEGGSTRVHIKHREKLRLPVLVRATFTIEGRRIVRDAMAIDEVSIPCPVASCSKPHIDLDPDRFGFDTDRFNNSTRIRLPALFPGNADTLADDTRTVVWLPFGARRSGQPWVLGVATATLNYVRSGLFLATGTTVPFDSWMLYSRYQKSVGFDGLMFAFDVQREVEGTAEAGLELSRRSEVGTFFVADYGIRASYLHAPNERWNQGHLPVGLDLEIEGLNFFENRLRLGVRAAVDGGRSLGGKSFSYIRPSLGIGSTAIPTPWSTLKLNGFYGLLESKGSVPASALLDPQDYRVAAMRIDVQPRTLLLSSELRAGSLELHFPLPFVRPNTDTVVLSSSKLRWFLFGDVAQARLAKAKHFSWLSDYGSGLLLPFGGDVGGAGSIVVASMAAELVIGKYREGRWSNDPSFLFGFSRSW